MCIKTNFSLKGHNTFGIDIKARFFAEVSTEEELMEMLFLEEFSLVPKLILGGGSNILFSKDYSGLVINIALKGIRKVKECDNKVFVEAGAGELWHDLVLYAIKEDLGGIENLSLIPGTVGAAPMQNIGAYGVELKDVFSSLSALNIETGEIEEFTKEQCRFGYRTSIFKQELKNKYVITSVRLMLNKEPELNLTYSALSSEIERLNLEDIGIADVSNVVTKIRKSKLPDPEVLGNAGSFFKNPIVPRKKYYELKQSFEDMPAFTAENGVKLAAGWLIEKAGWKGKRVGNAACHEKQALVIVNTGGAQPGEVLELASMIKNSVKDTFGVELEEEVNII